MASARAVKTAAVIGGVTVTSVDKPWFPDDGITKGDVVRYYDRVAPLILSWLRDRPLTAERCPDGMRGQCFYQKDFPAGRPPADVPRLTLRAASTGKDVHDLVGGTKRALLAMTNLGCIAMHVMNARTARLRDPDWLAFDLDPTSGEFADAARAGLLLRRVLDEARLPSFPKTSGSRGLHVFVPLRAGQAGDRVVAYATAIGEELARRDPKLVTMAHAKSARRGRVYADPFRNSYLQTIVAPYSVRRRPGATISAPLAWDEVSARLDPSRFTIRTFEKRTTRGDPWDGFKRHAVKLPD